MFVVGPCAGWIVDSLAIIRSHKVCRKVCGAPGKHSATVLSSISNPGLRRRHFRWADDMSSIVLQNDVKFSEDGEQIIEGQDVD